MKIETLKKGKDKVVFTLEGVNPAVVNTLRRYAMNYVPTLAIEEVTVKENNSALYDEMVAHRLGLVPLVTDLKSYTVADECKCKGKGCAQCQLVLSLKVKGPATVYSGDIKSKDPKVKAAHDKIPIVKLLKDQEVNVELKAVVGRGKDHAKFSPGIFYYKGFPSLKTSKDSNTKVVLDACKDVLTQKGSNLEIKDVLVWNEAHEEICELNNITVEYSDEKFLCTMESWGQIDAKEILTEAVNVFEKKVETFEGLIKKLK